MRKHIFIAILIFTTLLVVPSCLWVQQMDEQSVVLRLGKMERCVKDPGVKFKLPYPFEERTTYTKRYIIYNSPEVDAITTDKKTIRLDTVAFFTISDPEKFYVKFKTVANAGRWVDDTIYSAIRSRVGSITFDDVIFAERSAAPSYALKTANDKGKDLGISVNSVYVKRTSIPKSNEDSVFASMIAERQQQATQIRAEGAARAKQIISHADRTYTVKVSEAERKAERIKGDADKEAQAMIDKTTQAAPGLYAYIKTLGFYQKIIPGTPVIIKADGILSGLNGQ